MQNLYPLFERNRILKKELLWSLRDYSFAHIQLEYQEYADGMLRGCEIEVEGDKLSVGPGLVKHRGFIYLITEKMTVPYEPTEKLEILKMKAERDTRSEDYIQYRLHLFCDSDPEKKEDELEVCRFKLRRGSVLRSQYKDFGDMATEYDTVNVIHADWGGLGGKTLSPAVTRCFGEAVLGESGSEAEDIGLAYLCLNQPGTVARRVLEHYVQSRTEMNTLRRLDNEQLFQAMTGALRQLRQKKRDRATRQEMRRQIMVD